MLTDETNAKGRIAAMPGVQADASEPMARRLVSARLMAVIRLLRDSAMPQYERSVGINELNRQLLTMIGGFGGLTSNDLVALSGHEKAQISRAVKSMEAADLIGRTSLRAKLMLRAAGQEMFEKVMAISHDRDMSVGRGISAAERKQFINMTRALTVRAAQIYIDERRLSAEAAAAGDCVYPPAPPVPSFGTGEDPHGLREMLAPTITALVSYTKRSAMLAYQRQQGLSNFQWMILSQIGEYEPLPLARLIEIMSRDKSQVGRTVAHFEQIGLVDRHRVARKRDIMVTTTPLGSETYKAMCEIAIRRDDVLTADLGPDGRRVYLALLDKVEANARRLLEEQRAEAEKAKGLIV